MRIILSWSKFRKVFGFEPTSDLDAERPLYWDAEQRVVNQKLKQLAEAFRQADRTERTAAAALDRVTTADELMEARNTRAYYRECVRKAKDAFWHAHKLAQEAGFAVSEKYSDYLESEWR